MRVLSKSTSVNTTTVFKHVAKKLSPSQDKYVVEPGETPKTTLILFSTRTTSNSYYLR